MSADQGTPEDFAPGTATTLPASIPVRSGRSTRFVVILSVIVVLVLAGIAGVVVALQGSTTTTAAPVAARAQNKVPKTAVFATSGAVVTDAAGVMKDAEALLAGKLPAATISESVRNSLVRPPSASTTATVVGAALALDDPQLPSCIASVTGGDTLFGIDRISYAGAPSLLIVTADANSASDAFAYVVGPGCALPGTGIRTVVTVPL